MRGSHQRAEAAARIESLPLSRRGRDETLGGVGRDGGYVNQHRECSGSASVETVAPGAPLVAGARAKAPPTLNTYSPGTSGADSEMPILRRKVTTRHQRQRTHRRPRSAANLQWRSEKSKFRDPVARKILQVERFNDVDSAFHEQMDVHGHRGRHFFESHRVAARCEYALRTDPARAFELRTRTRCLRSAASGDIASRIVPEPGPAGPQQNY